jgi:hypothetical protein
MADLEADGRYIKMDLRGIGCEGVDGIELTQDRIQRRDLVIYFQVP